MQPERKKNISKIRLNLVFLAGIGFDPLRMGLSEPLDIVNLKNGRVTAADRLGRRSSYADNLPNPVSL